MKAGYLLATLLLLLVGKVEAQTLTVKDAISRALEKNHLVRAAGHEVTAARQMSIIANSRYYPVISLEETLAASNAPTQTFMMKLDQARFSQDDFKINNLNHPSTWQDFKTTLQLQQPLYVPSLSPLARIAAKEAEKSELGLESARQDTAFQVFSLYLEARKSEAQLKAADKAVADALENMRLATVRTAAGVGLRSDELRARTHLSMVEQQLFTARNNLTLAKLRLAITIGWPEDKGFEVPTESENTFAKLLSDDTTKLALETRADLKQYQTEIEKSEAAVKLANSEYLPSLAAFASYQLNSKDAPFGIDNDAWIAGATLKWRLFDGFRRGAERSRAVAARSAAREMFDNKANEVRYQSKESLLRREEAGKRLEVARHALVDAEETVRLITKRYENSLATMLELLDAQTVLNQSRANLVEMETGYALAGGRVYYSSGTFLKEMLK
ncbi:MAG: TolC family protein [Deltaproteobacteria bacterium]|nr:TolC family protein [Deltaproteobacteria bacterium]